VGLATQLTANLATIQAIKYFGPHIYSPWLIRNILPRQRGEWLAIALAFLPPIAMEELLFRTLLIGTFQMLIPLPFLIVITSIIFGLMHQPQGKLGMIAAGAVNILFCLLFVWTGELLVTLVAHYVVNMLQLVAAYYQQDWLEQLASENL
jgi:membrane protease YdiL (CAAX protease family)